MSAHPLPRGPRDLPLADYGLVGDGRSAALVSSEGSVDWWCPGRFDAPSVFAHLLDRDAGGRFALGVPVAHRREFAYVDDTNVLRARIVAARGAADVTTWMPHAEAGHDPPNASIILRLVEGRRGEVPFALAFEPRFDYARVAPRLRNDDGQAVAAAPGLGALRLAADVPLDVGEPSARAEFVVRAGERVAFVLSWGEREPARVEDPRALAEESLAREIAHWQAWISRCTYEGPYEDAVRRSMLALKLMQHVPTGAFVAAPTLGLPEIPGMGENWDYRYSWLRDGSFIVMAFETMGYKEEALAFRRWLAEIAKRDSPDRLQTLYRVDGGRDVPESALDHLSGYLGSRPVYLGNRAVQQRQLDTYGELMMCFHRADELFREQGEALWPALRALVERVAEEWRGPDSGIWELRDHPRQYVYSKGMAWLALDHGVQIARKHGYDAPVERWRRAADEVRAFVEREGRAASRGYVQAADRRLPDASLLLLAQLGYADPRDDAMRATTREMMDVLGGHGLLHRHLQEESRGSEGAFLPASFWLAHQLAHEGRVREARRWFEAALRVAGPLGLLPEEADPVTREGLGNHPQALSHLALVLAAYAIREAERRAGALRAGAGDARADAVLRS